MTVALAIFVKTPGYSPVKTRLAATTGQAAATEFHRMAARAVGEVARAAGEIFAPFWAVAERTALNDPQWRSMPCIWQEEGELGERLHHVYARLQSTYQRVLLLGADTPQVTPELLYTAMAALDDPQTPFVLGDAPDGGFWLFGGREPIPRETWCGVRYSQADTTAQLRSALPFRAGVATLPTLTDVDEAGNLNTLRAALDSLAAPLPAQQALAHWLAARTENTHTR